MSPPPRNVKENDRRRIPVADKDHRAVVCSGGSATIAATSITREDVARRKERAAFAQNSAQSVSPSTTIATITSTTSSVLLPPGNGKDNDLRRTGVAVKDRPTLMSLAAQSASPSTTTTTTTSSVVLPPRNGKANDLRRTGVAVQDRPTLMSLAAQSATSSSTTVSTTAAAASRNSAATAHNMCNRHKGVVPKGGNAATAHSPISIRPESLSSRERQPTCWQMTRHRMSKTRGEF